MLLFMRGVPPRAPRLRALARTRTGAKSGAIFAALGEICGLAVLCLQLFDFLIDLKKVAYRVFFETWLKLSDGVNGLLVAGKPL